MRISDWSSDVCSSDLAGVLCMPTVGALKHAVKAVELGADIITVQGAEGGGHTGSVPTTLLLPQVLDAVKVPVVAAGGFHSGRGLRSEEHTSELQSLTRISYAVFCLKKKKKPPEHTL